MKINTPAPGYHMFMCPVCKTPHAFNDTWTWNQDANNPTVTPSLLVTRKGTDLRCHSYITNGKIQFLSDCNHKLAGQTLELEDWELGE